LTPILSLPADAAFVFRPLSWAVIAAAYLLGSIPFGLVLAKWIRGVDLRQFGSGNIGAANAVRAMGRGWGLVAFALDFLKGWAPVFFCAHYAGEDPRLVPLLLVVCGTAAVLGHCYSIYLGFRGGKGVATGCGAIVAIDPRIFLAGGVVWLVTLFTTRYVGLASIMMGLTFPIATWFLADESERALLIGSTLLTVLILVRHRSNLQRMLAGTEPRAGSKPSSSHAAKPHG
jgi:glycerol-3-phosphate acyltransferase PlsY